MFPTNSVNKVVMITITKRELAVFIKVMRLCIVDVITRLQISLNITGASKLVGCPNLVSLTLAER